VTSAVSNLIDSAHLQVFVAESGARFCVYRMDHLKKLFVADPESTKFRQVPAVGMLDDDVLIFMTNTFGEIVLPVPSCAESRPGTIFDHHKTSNRQRRIQLDADPMTDYVFFEIDEDTIGFRPQFEQES